MSVQHFRVVGCRVFKSVFQQVVPIWGDGPLQVSTSAVHVDQIRICGCAVVVSVWPASLYSCLLRRGDIRIWVDRGVIEADFYPLGFGQWCKGDPALDHPLLYVLG